MRFNAFNIGEKNEEGKSIYVDFHVYRYLFELMMANTIISDELFDDILQEYDNAMYTKKKRIRHKKMKKIYQIMETMQHLYYQVEMVD